jgi:hypothetical protein
VNRAVAIDPVSGAAYTALGRCLRGAGKSADAAAALARAVELDPSQPQAHYELALALLERGELARGFCEYAWRVQVLPGLPSRHRPPDWRRALDQGVLIRPEQGLGTQIMFASCVGDLIERRAQTILECDARLRPLFARSFPQAVVRQATPLGAGADGETSLLPLPRALAGDLPALFRRDFEDFPRRRSFLRADPEQIARWKARLAGFPGRAAAISWCGGADAESMRRRSTALADWVGLLQTPGYCFINVQHGAARRDARELAGRFAVSIVDFPDLEPLVDVDGLAALLSAVDLVITVDNTTAHLAGALGTPTWTLLPRPADWRWFLDRHDSPWYDAMHLYRQSSPGDWGPVLARVRADLHQARPSRSIA